MHEAPSLPAQAELTKGPSSHRQHLSQSIQQQAGERSTMLHLFISIGPERKCAGKFVNSFLTLAETLFQVLGKFIPNPSSSCPFSTGLKCRVTLPCLFFKSTGDQWPSRTRFLKARLEPMKPRHRMNKITQENSLFKQNIEKYRHPLCCLLVKQAAGSISLSSVEIQITFHFTKYCDTTLSN